MSYRQFDLVSGNTHLRTWLEDDKRLFSGVELTLRGDDRVWTVTWRYAATRNDAPHKDWKVGGLA